MTTPEQRQEQIRKNSEILQARNEKGTKILSMKDSGFTNAEIAKALGLSVSIARIIVAGA